MLRCVCHKQRSHAAAEAVGMGPEMRVSAAGLWVALVRSFEECAFCVCARNVCVERHGAKRREIARYLIHSKQVQTGKQRDTLAADWLTADNLFLAYMQRRHWRFAHRVV